MAFRQKCLQLKESLAQMQKDFLKHRKVENLSTTLKLVNFLVDGFEDEPQIAGPLILAFLNIFKILMVEYENDFRSNLCKITKTFCKLSKLRCEIELDLLHLWYEICQQAPIAVRLIVYKEDAVNWFNCIEYILKCGRFHYQFLMMEILFSYTGINFNANDVDFSKLFEGFVPDIESLRKQLRAFNTVRINERVAVVKCIRDFINFLNRTVTKNVITRVLQYVRFDSRFVNLYPDHEAYIDFNCGSNTLEFSYTENDVLKFAILDNENIGILKIAKPHHEFCLTATLEKPLLIRDGIGSILGNDTSGIKTVTMQLYGDFEESDMIELFGNIIPGKYNFVEGTTTSDDDIVIVDMSVPSTSCPPIAIKTEKILSPNKAIATGNSQNHTETQLSPSKQDPHNTEFTPNKESRSKNTSAHAESSSKERVSSDMNDKEATLRYLAQLHEQREILQKRYKNASSAKDWKSLIRLVNFLVESYECDPQSVGSLFLHFIDILPTFAAKYKDGLCADFSNITKIFCKLTNKVRNQSHFGLSWMASWYKLCKEAPLDVRMAIYEQNLQDLRNCVSYLLKCGKYNKQFLMISIIFAYATMHFEASKTDVSLLFDRMVTDMTGLREHLQPFNVRTDDRIEVVKRIRTFLNYLNETQTTGVVSFALRSVRFDERDIDLFPENEAYVDFNYGNNTIEFSYKEQKMKVAIIHKDNLLFLTIRKSIDECRLIAVLNNPLQIREGISSSYDDSTGIKTIDMQLKGNVHEDQLNELFSKMICGKYAFITTSVNECALSNFAPIAESTPAPPKAKRPFIQTYSPISSNPSERKITVTAEIHQEPIPPIPPIPPKRTTGHKKRTPKKQHGLDNIEVLESVDLIPKTPAKNNENDARNEEIVEMVSVDSVEQSNTVEEPTVKQALLAKKSSSKKAENVSNVGPQGKPSTATTSKKASVTMNDTSEVAPDPFDFVDDSPPKQRRSRRLGAKQSNVRIKEMIEAQREMSRYLGNEAKPTKKRKSVTQQPKQTATKRSLPPVEQGPVVKKRLLNVTDYNSYGDLGAGNNCDDESRIARRKTFQRPKQFDELTTSSFDSAALNNPQAKMARVMHNVKRLSEATAAARSAASPLNEINVNVLASQQQRTSRIANKNVTYSYRKSMTTTTATVVSQTNPETVAAMGVWSNEIEEVTNSQMMETDDAYQQSFDIIERSMHQIDECVFAIQNKTNTIREEMRFLQSKAIRSQSASRSDKAIDEN